jgi:hypothetical protein
LKARALLFTPSLLDESLASLIVEAARAGAEIDLVTSGPCLLVSPADCGNLRLRHVSPLRAPACEIYSFSSFGRRERAEHNIYIAMNEESEAGASLLLPVLDASMGRHIEKLLGELAAFDDDFMAGRRKGGEGKRAQVAASEGAWSKMAIC